MVLPVSAAVISLGTIDCFNSSEVKTPSSQPPFNGVAATTLRGGGAGVVFVLACAIAGVIAGGVDEDDLSFGMQQR